MRKKLADSSKKKQARGISVDNELYGKLVRQAEKEQRSYSQMVRVAIAKYLKEGQQ